MEGTDDIVDLIPVPGTVKEEGTFLNVKNLLKDSTAALLGGDSSMVPDEALVALINLIKGLDAESVGALSLEVVSWTGTGSKTKTVVFSKRPKMVILARGSDEGLWDFSYPKLTSGAYAILLWGITTKVYFYVYASGDPGTTITYASDTTLTFANTYNAIVALNGSSIKYSAIAIY